MDIYLSINNNAETVKLPVVPRSFLIESAFSNEVISTVTSNDIKSIGNRGLRSLEISSFFPIKDYPFLKNRDIYGWSYVKTIERWRDLKIPVRLIITDTDINLAVTIDRFSYGVQDGTGDIYYSLTLGEYKFVELNKLTSIPISKPVIQQPVVSSTSNNSSGSNSVSSNKYSASTPTSNAQAKQATMTYISADKQNVKLTNELTNKEKKIITGQADRITQSTTPLTTAKSLNDKAVREMESSLYSSDVMSALDKVRLEQDRLASDKYGKENRYNSSGLIWGL